MFNPITFENQPDLDDLVRMIDGKTVCKVCGQDQALYSTDNGYVCRKHAR